MKGMCFLLALAWLAASPHAMAQPQPSALPPLESVTVTATKATREAIASFIFSHAKPSRVTDKLTRWRRGICPLTIGLGDKYATHVTQRLRAVAASIGAPVNKDPKCRPNVRIVFTTEPQALLDNIRKDAPAMLGYFDNQAQITRAATFIRPVQSWYTTATGDLRGFTQTDSPNPTGLSIRLPPPPGNGMSEGSMYTMDLPYANARSSNGTRLGDGLTTEFTNVTIVAEPARLLDMEIGTLADYIAVLALSQPASLDSCGELSSITNLFSSVCRGATKTITDADLAYLRGLYKMQLDGSLQAQRGQVRYQMERALEGR